MTTFQTPSGPPPSRLSKLADSLKSIATIIVSLIIVLMLGIVVDEVMSPTPTIENVSAPELAQKLGYTSTVLTQKISDGTRSIAVNAKRDFDVAYPRKWVSIQVVEAQIPASNFTVRSAAQFMSAILNYPSKRITGEITKLDDAFDVTIRLVDGESLSTKIQSPNGRFDADQIVAAASQMAMQLTYPYVLAASFYNDEKSGQQPDFAKTRHVLDYLIAKNQDLYYAHNLKCNVLLQLFKIDEAKKECSEAIKIDPENWPAQANLGYLYYQLASKGFNPLSSGFTSDAKANCQTAIEWFGKAEKRHPLTFLR